MTELSARRLLTPYLFTVTRDGRATWYGVSGYSFADALGLLREAGYALDPTDPALEIREHSRFTEFERQHVAANMGPMQFRGVWYPRHNL